MLAAAREKVDSDRVHWQLGDLRQMPDGTYDAIVCLCDSFNYLLSEEEVRHFFAQCQKRLSEAGVLIVDMHSMDRLDEFAEEYNETGVVNGVSETEYDPHVSITREQLAAMIYRYAEYKGYDVSATTSLDSYDDAGDVSDYAAEALAWAVAEGLVEGVDDNTLQPQGTASSEQIATILERFVANIA